MLLAREFLRLAVLEALRPSALLEDPAAAWPTIAGRFVFDSGFAPIDDQIGAEDRTPVVSVYTENASLTKIAQAGPIFYRGDVDLIFEIGVVSQMHDDDIGDFVGYRDTDAGCEAILGSLEDQIFHSLHFSDGGAMFRKMIKLPFTEWHSATLRSGEENSRLARRAVSTKIAMREACYVALPHQVAEGLDRLPPLLRDIAQQLAPSTYLHELALGMAAVAPQMPIRPLLQSVGIDIKRNEQPLGGAEANKLQG